MDEDIKSHGDQCNCTYCDKDTQKETESIFKNQKFDELSDGMGNIKPEVYTFAEQSKDEVLKMFKAANKAESLFSKAYKLKREEEARLRQNLGGELKVEDRKQGCPLLYEDAPACDDIKLSEYKPLGSSSCRDYSREDAGTLALWRKLSGVRPQENLEAAKKIPTIMDTILMLCKRKFTSGLTVEWSDEGWNRCLVINNAKTKIRADDLVAAWEGLKHVTDEDDAARIVSDVIVKKLERLFI